mmetsp:Transcript_50598/g.94796  ORF Transcript_50598/g.94796 Transcript_50598/m.94796 type:complete len:81 (+) Transcript_50598:187-429(+)
MCTAEALKKGGILIAKVLPMPVPYLKLPGARRSLRFLALHDSPALASNFLRQPRASSATMHVCSTRTPHVPVGLRERQVR